MRLFMKAVLLAGVLAGCGGVEADETAVSAPTEDTESTSAQAIPPRWPDCGTYHGYSCGGVAEGYEFTCYWYDMGWPSTCLCYMGTEGYQYWSC